MLSNLTNDLKLNAYARILIAISKQRGESKTRLGKMVDLTYSHTIQVLLKLEECGLAYSTKKGRVSSIDLTEDGLLVADYFDRIETILLRHK